MIVLKGARLIDGTGAAPVDGATVVIDGNRIDAVTHAQPERFPGRCRDHRRRRHDGAARA